MTAFNLNRHLSPLGGGAARARRGRGFVLVVVLIMVVLLAVLAASYAFQVNAHIDTVMAEVDQYHARMAAYSGFQRTVVMLRDQRANPAAWLNNPDAFRGLVVYGPKERREDAFKKRVDEDTTYDPTAKASWKVSAIAPNEDVPGTVRYGVTAEGARLNLNSATEKQLQTLFQAVVPPSDDPDRPVDVNVMVDSLLDWREAGQGPRPNGAKNEYYQSLKPPYRCKQAPFSTVEELLLVRGFSGWVVFGEDFNQNGLLDANEDDGDVTFPPDDHDGQLFRGVAPYFTLWSREWNMSSDNKPRINLNMRDTEKLQTKLEEFFDGDIVDYIIRMRGSGKTFTSVMKLLPAPPVPESLLQEIEDAKAALAEYQAEQAAKQAEKQAQQQAQQQGQQGQPATQPATLGGDQGAQQSSTSAPADADFAGDEPTGNNEGPTSQPADASGTPKGSEKGPPKVPEIPDAYKNLTDEIPPAEYGDLPLILDRLTALPPAMSGRIDVNTAPRPVLLTLEGVTPEQVDAIVAARPELQPEQMLTPAWLLMQGVMDEVTFRNVLDKITTSSVVFRAELLGYADHRGVVHRLNTVFEMRGPFAQVLYERDLTGLGAAYRPHAEEDRRDITDR